MSKTLANSIILDFEIILCTYHRRCIEHKQHAVLYLDYLISRFGISWGLCSYSKVFISSHHFVDLSLINENNATTFFFERTTWNITDFFNFNMGHGLLTDHAHLQIKLTCHLIVIIGLTLISQTHTPHKHATRNCRAFLFLTFIYKINQINVYRFSRHSLIVYIQKWLNIANDIIGLSMI